MAYDPKDKDDKKIVDKLIADAVAAAIADISGDDDHEAHTEAVKGLVAKNKELLKKLAAAKKGDGSDPEEVRGLETQIETLKGELKVATKAAKDAAKERDTFKQTAETETTASRKLLVDQGLTEALLANNVGKQFIPAARALLQGQVTIKVDGENRTAMVGDKALGDFVKTWSQGDDGKNFVVAPVNGGSGAPGGQAKVSGKTMARSAFEGLTPVAQASYMKEGGTLTN